MKVTYRVHAVRRMFERGITEADVHTALSEGDEIAAYPGDTPHPSRLLLGWRGNKMGSEGESNEMRSVQTGGNAPRCDHGDV